MLLGTMVSVGAVPVGLVVGCIDGNQLAGRLAVKSVIVIQGNVLLIKYSSGRCMYWSGCKSTGTASCC
jgi:hypothetical protein